uniref:Pre-mRNA 3'-end-processing factor FIP1 n=1 Tax=Oryzias melastigma TaxID=30732 RepID=A0A3B3CAV7_ORYME
MSAEEADKTTTTDASAGDEEEEWLYGGKTKCKDMQVSLKLIDINDNNKIISWFIVELNRNTKPPASQKTAGEDVVSDSDSDDDDDDVRVTIGDIKTGAPQYTLKKVKISCLTTESVFLSVGADLSDYFNYGFNEDSWKAYCEKQKRLRMGLDVSTVGSVTSKITVQQGRTGNEKDISSLPVHTSKTDFPSPISLYKDCPGEGEIHPERPSEPRHSDIFVGGSLEKSCGTIDVIGGGTATISRVEGRRRHNLEGNNIQVQKMTQTQKPLHVSPVGVSPAHSGPAVLSAAPQVISEHSTSDAEPAPAKIPTFFPPGPIPPNIPPPPFLGHPGGYDGRSVPPYPFPQGAYPPPMGGGVPQPWPVMMDNTKSWDYYPRREDKREKERDRPRERAHEREREREHSPSAVGYTSDEERYRYREYQERVYAERHRDRASREKEDRHRERRHREKDEGRHKSSRSSSRRRHDSEEGDSHRRHKHKKSKRSKEGKEASEEIGADQENQEAME